MPYLSDFYQDPLSENVTKEEPIEEQNSESEENKKEQCDLPFQEFMSKINVLSKKYSH